MSYSRLLDFLDMLTHAWLIIIDKHMETAGIKQCKILRTSTTTNKSSLTKKAAFDLYREVLLRDRLVCSLN